MICVNCNRNLPKCVFRNMGGGVHWCKDCYAGNPIVQAVQEIVERTTVKVVVSQSPTKKIPAKEETKILKKVAKKKKPAKKRK